MSDHNKNATKEESKEIETQHLSPIPLGILFFGICIMSLMIILYSTIVATAIPAITSYFHTVEDVDWYSTTQLLVTCAVQPLTGQIYNQFRVKYTYLTFMSFLALGTVICGVSRSSSTFIVGRAIEGLGTAGLFNGSMVMLTAAAPPSIRAQLLSISIAMVGIGGVLGPVVGGTVTKHKGWRWCMWIFLPILGAVAVAFIVLRIPEQISKPPVKSVVRNLHHKLDLIGAAIFVPTVIMFMLAVSWGGSKYAWDSATIIGLLCAAPVMVILFGAWLRYKRERAIIPLTLLTKKVVACAVLVSFLQGGAFFMIGYYLPLWFQSIKGVDPEKSGIMLLPTALSQIFAAIGCSALLRIVPYAASWAMFGNAMTAIGTGLMTTFIPSTKTGQWIGYQILAGIGRGIALQMPVLSVQGTLPAAEIPIATGILLFGQYFGGSIINCIAKTVFLNALKSALLEYAPNVKAESVINIGATQLSDLVGSNDLAGVVKAYNKALTTTFWLPCAVTCLAFFCSIGLGWHKLATKGKSKNKADSADTQSDNAEKEARPKQSHSSEGEKESAASVHESAV